MQEEDFHVMAAVFWKNFSEIALVKNAAYAGKPPGWGLPGGRSKCPGDRPEERLREEVYEETGIEGIEILTLVFLCREEEQGKKIKKFFYLARALDEGNSGQAVYNRDGKKEIEKWGWFDFNPPRFSGLPLMYKKHFLAIRDKDFQYLVWFQKNVAAEMTSPR